MANYDRRILVPYLRDVCSVEMLCRKLEQDVAYYRREADKYAQWANRTYADPPKPDRINYSMGDESASAGAPVFVIIILVGIWLCSVPFLCILGIPAILYGLLGVWVMLSENHDAKRKGDERFQHDMEVYRKQVEQNRQWRAQKSGWKASSDKLRAKQNQAEKNLDMAKTLRAKLYSVNIIATKYRSIHAAYYLYDYFSTSRETDLDKIIQTMLLEEIIQRLDKIIAQLQDVLLNQRRQIAIQDSQNRMIAENHREEMKRIANMEKNQELQLDYQHMIERNQEVTNFFLAADYIERHR